MPTALLLRPDEQVFASAANTGEVIQYPDIPRGWGLTFDSADAGGNGGFPPMEWFNYVLARIDAATQYFMQRGVTEWAATTLYAGGSVTSYANLIYRSLRSHSNVRPGSDPATWIQLADTQASLQLAPPGASMLYTGPSLPAGWLKANGASLSRGTYSALFGAIGTTYGALDGNSFNLPDARGEFLRCWDDGRGADRGRAFGSWQGADMQPHMHGGTALWVGDHSHGGSAWTDVQGWHGHGASCDVQGNHQHSLPNNGSVQAGADNGGAQTTASTPYASGRGQNPTDWGGTHYHNIGIAGDGNHAHNVGLSIGAAGGHQHAIQTDWQGGTETRPRNIAWMACIKY